MKIVSKILVLFISFAFLYSCVKKEDQTISDLDKLRNSNNKITYSAIQMDSAQAINSITSLKVQQLLELSTLYLTGNKNTKIDTVIYSQMQSYFQKPDSTTFKPLFKELDSLKVKEVKVKNLSVYKEIKGQDTLDFVKFNVEYFDNKKKSLGIFEKNAQYTLVSKPINFKKEFKFYFLNFYQPLPSLSKENTK